jgi:subtilisin family serine protease
VTTSSFGNFVAGLTVMVATAAIMYLTAGATTLRADRDLRAGLHLFTTMGLASLVLYSVSGPSGGGLVTTLGAFAVGLWFVAALGVIVVNLARRARRRAQRRADARVVARMERDLNG